MTLEDPPTRHDIRFQPSARRAIAQRLPDSVAAAVLEFCESTLAAECQRDRYLSQAPSGDVSSSPVTTVQVTTAVEHPVLLIIVPGCRSVAWWGRATGQPASRAKSGSIAARYRSQRPPRQRMVAAALPPKTRNLLDRNTEARQQGWAGEVEGLKVSLAGAEQKLAQPDEIAQRRAATVQLGISTFVKVAGRTSTGDTR